MTTKRAGSRRSDELRSEYNLRELKKPVRGKYYARAAAGTNLVLLDPDVAEAFADARAVNDALRVLVTLARSRVRNGRKGRRQSA